MKWRYKVSLMVAAFFVVIAVGAITVKPAAAAENRVYIDNEGWWTDSDVYQTSSLTYTEIFRTRITHLPKYDPYGFEDIDYFAMNVETIIGVGSGPVYIQIRGSYASTGEIEVNVASDWVFYENHNIHRADLGTTQRVGWHDALEENYILYLIINAKAPAGSSVAIRNIRYYAYDNTAFTYENDFTVGDDEDAGTGTEDDPFIVENKYIYTVTPHDDNGIEVLDADSSYWVIRNCAIANADYGIYVENASNGVIQSNVIDNCNIGIYLKDCDNISVFGNRLLNSVSTGAYLEGCTDVTFYYNYFESSTVRHAYDNAINSWDVGGRGNYWDDWQPPAYPEIGDTGVISLPRSIYGGFGVDAYPLVIAAGAYGTVVSIVPGNQSGAVGNTISFTVSIQNLGWDTATYDLVASDTESWTLSLQSSIIIGPYSTESATMDVVVSSATVVGGSNTITVTATDQANSSNTASSTCIAIVTVTADVGISAWPAMLATGLGTSTESAGILLSTMLLLAIVFPLAYIGTPMEGMTIIVIILIGLTTALGWMPVWIALLVGIGFSLILARQLSSW